MPREPMSISEIRSRNTRSARPYRGSRRGHPTSCTCAAPKGRPACLITNPNVAWGLIRSPPRIGPPLPRMLFLLSKDRYSADAAVSVPLAQRGKPLPAAFVKIDLVHPVTNRLLRRFERPTQPLRATIRPRYMTIPLNTNPTLYSCANTRHVPYQPKSRPAPIIRSRL